MSAKVRLALGRYEVTVETAERAFDPCPALPGVAASDHAKEGTSMKMGLWIVVGVVIGTAIGAAMNQTAMGVALGTAFGVALGAVFSRRRQ